MNTSSRTTSQSHCQRSRHPAVYSTWPLCPSFAWLDLNDKWAPRMTLMSYPKSNNRQLHWHDVPTSIQHHFGSTHADCAAHGQCCTFDQCRRMSWARRNQCEPCLGQFGTCDCEQTIVSKVDAIMINSKNKTSSSGTHNESWKWLNFKHLLLSYSSRTRLVHDC